VFLTITSTTISSSYVAVADRQVLKRTVEKIIDEARTREEAPSRPIDRVALRPHLSDDFKKTLEQGSKDRQEYGQAKSEEIDFSSFTVMRLLACHCRAKSSNVVQSEGGGDYRWAHHTGRGRVCLRESLGSETSFEDPPAEEDKRSAIVLRVDSPRRPASD